MKIKLLIFTFIIIGAVGFSSGRFEEKFSTEIKEVSGAANHHDKEIAELLKSATASLDVMPDISIDLAQKAAAKAQQIKSDAALVNSYTIMGSAYYNKGDISKSIQWYEKAATLAGARGLIHESMLVNYNLGLAYRKAKKDKKAAECHTLSIAAANKLENRDMISLNHFVLADLFAAMRRYEEALKQYRAFVQYRFVEFEKESKDITTQIKKKEEELVEAKQKETRLVQDTVRKSQTIQELHQETKVKDKVIQEKNETVRRQQKTIFYASMAITVFILLISGVLWQYRQKRRAYRKLEEQNQMIMHQKEQIENQKEEITNSIQYALRIQQAVLPTVDLRKVGISDHFVFYLPRDIVSGDFYWYAPVANQLIIAVADCTGHGVPGAFMSMLGVSYINEIVINRKVTMPDEILNTMRAEIIRTMHQKGNASENKDGMDIALINIDFEKKKIWFSGAYNPLTYVRDGKLFEIKADKMPCAYHPQINPFSLQELDFRKGDIFYLSSDGYSDQFGGPDGKKFKQKRFNELLLSVSHLPMSEQKKVIEQSFYDWKSNQLQLDDVLVMGISI